MAGCTEMRGESTNHRSLIWYNYSVTDTISDQWSWKTKPDSRTSVGITHYTYHLVIDRQQLLPSLGQRDKHGLWLAGGCISLKEEGKQGKQMAKPDSQPMMEPCELGHCLIGNRPSSFTVSEERYATGSVIWQCLSVTIGSHDQFAPSIMWLLIRSQLQLSSVGLYAPAPS